ncbi:hypothetical protein L1049_007628 [Liquidambar formosana]|uniref:Uncharacterized protein n=1 Tax=Liquidambar formosana TaxID=63359 RepID=A0AAP0S1U5_LIQFO
MYNMRNINKKCFLKFVNSIFSTIALCRSWFNLIIYLKQLVLYYLLCFNFASQFLLFIDMKSVDFTHMHPWNIFVATNHFIETVIETLKSELYKFANLKRDAVKNQKKAIERSEILDHHFSNIHKKEK